MAIKAYKIRFPYADPDKYALLLKQKFMFCEPRFWVAVRIQEIVAVDGPMFALRYSDDLELPNGEPIGECMINGLQVFLWRGFSWLTAVDAHGASTRHEALGGRSISGTMIIYKLSETKVE